MSEINWVISKTLMTVYSNVYVVVRFDSDLLQVHLESITQIDLKMVLNVEERFSWIKQNFIVRIGFEKPTVFAY